MKIARTCAALLAASVVTIGAVGIAAPAQADTSWGCAACRPGR